MQGRFSLQIRQQLSNMLYTTIDLWNAIRQIQKNISSSSSAIPQRTQDCQLPLSYIRFTLSRLASVFSNLVQVSPQSIPDSDSFVRLWYHEICRTFQDPVELTPWSNCILDEISQARITFCEKLNTKPDLDISRPLAWTYFNFITNKTAGSIRRDITTYQSVDLSKRPESCRNLNSSLDSSVFNAPIQNNISVIVFAEIMSGKSPANIESKQWIGMVETQLKTQNTVDDPIAIGEVSTESIEGHIQVTEDMVKTFSTYFHYRNFENR